MSNNFRLGLLVAIFLAPVFDAALPRVAEAKNKSKQEATAPESHRFFSFDEAPYYTSPDKRIGAKMLIDSARVGPTLSAMQHITYLPGASVKSHRHVYVTEVIYVLKGHLTVRIDKEIKVLGPDTTAYIPPQTFHEYLNDPAAGEVCQFLQFYSPSGPEEEYRTWERPGDEASKTAKIAVATSPQEIKRGPLAAIPGSPQTVLGAVKSSNGPSDTSLDESTPGAASRSYELKLAEPIQVATATSLLQTAPKKGAGAAGKSVNTQTTKPASTATNPGKKSGK
ncbi:MAG: cupin domain-containing protein [Candidatus Riflebacteria bacterium]|nr:cupin domain-containing protein [Candidatus Riflebacteria bacterium]